MIRVLFLSHSSEKCGAERSLLILLRNLDRTRFEPVVALPGSGPLMNDMRELGVKVYPVFSPWQVRLKSRKPSPVREVVREARAVLTLSRIILREKINLVYTNTIVNFSGAIAAMLTRRVHVWHIREILGPNQDLEFPWGERFLFRFISMTSERIIANSNATASQFRTTAAANKVKVVYNAVAANRGPSQPKAEIPGVESTDWAAAVVGTLQWRKAPDDAIRALKIAAEKIPNIKLLVVGQGNQQVTDALHALCMQLDVASRVVFTGFRNDVEHILCGCKVLLVPSLMEPFGRVIIEAMALGVPVIAVNSGGPREIITDGVNGYLVPPRSPSEMAKRMVMLFENPIEGSRLAIEGKRTVADKFGAEQHCRQIERILAEVMGA